MSMLEQLIGQVSIDVTLSDPDFDQQLEVLDANVTYQRPDMGLLLTGCRPEQALKQIRLLYTLCPVAQQLAAAKGLGLATPCQPSAVVREWINEHSWQLAQMLLVTDPGINIMQPTVSLRTGDLSALTFLFGVAPAVWLSFSEQLIETWVAEQSAPYAKLMAQLTAPQWCYLGRNRNQATMGAIRRQSKHPFIAYAQRRWGELAQRIFSRLVELALLAVGEYQPAQAGYHSSAFGECGASIEAVRGKLTHNIRLNREGLIEAYQICTPTDAYCANRGELQQSLIGSRLHQDDLDKGLKLLVSAFDPCVGFVIHPVVGKQRISHSQG
ncbi:hypothetical protein L4D76_07685 [Photobacterium sagamiensis]|uniref:hypothetical protein n=1 Tax=Photobacterium sagamiensis TaxID=2910241 RepID=UPI003D12F2D3